jgi:predicted nucleic acid-binding Zn ribbon protein
MDEDASDDEDGREGDEDTTIPCPYCRRPIYEDSQRCPHCGNYISEEDAPAARKPWWIIVGALLVLYVVYRWIVG